MIFAYPQFKILHIKDSVISDIQSCETNTKYNRIENNNNFTKLSSPNIDKLGRLDLLGLGYGMAIIRTD